MIYREFEQLIPVLEEGGYHHRLVGESLRVQCPAHDGGDTSCSFMEYPDTKSDDDETILEPVCFSRHCEPAVIWAAIRQIARPKNPRRSTKAYDPKKAASGSGGYAGFDKASMKWERAAVYYFRTYDGKEFAPKVRLEPVDRKTGERVPGVRKMFVWDVKAADWPSRVPPLYRGHYLAGEIDYRPKALNLSDANFLVYLVEGEKDADRLASLDVYAVSPHTGSGSDLSAADVELLKKYVSDRGRVVIVPDLDAVGFEAALRWKASLEAAGVPVEMRASATGEEGSDVSDHLDAGFSLDDLIEVSDSVSPVPSPVSL